MRLRPQRNAASLAWRAAQALLVCMLLVPFAHAQDLAGEYALRGAPGTASELELLEDGRFSWLRARGGRDQLAQGRWTRDGDAVVLENDWSEEGPRFHRYLAGSGHLSDMALETAREIADSNPGHGAVIVVDPMMGGAPAVEFAIRYADGSERPLAVEEKWLRQALFPLAPDHPAVAIGLRDPAADLPMQWVELGRDETALAFALRTGLPPVFRTLRLRIDGHDLVPEWLDGGAEPGRYQPVVR